MDFLDPKAKRNHLIRLFVGYGLMGILILMGTAILVYQAYGFDVDRKTGQVIQNGLVFVDSAPDGASISFNGKVQKDRTNSRFALPSADYDLVIKKDGYRDWQRKFTLDGGEVERFYYPMLVPSNLSHRNVQTLTAAPTFTTQSPDRRWLIMNQGSSLTSFTEFDLNSLDDNDKPKTRQFQLPSTLFSASADAHTVELVEWSNDNKHFLVKHTFTGGVEYLTISRDQPDQSFNVNRLLGQNPTTITLRDKKFDQWYLYTTEGGVLLSANIDKVITPVLTGVTAYKTHDEKIILYSQAANDGATQRVSMTDGKDTYVIKDVAAGTVLLDIAKYDSEWYYAIGSDAEKKTYIYRNPITVLQKRDGTKPTPRSILKATGTMTQLSFSQNTRFIATQSGQHFEVFDAEYNQIYRYEINNAFDAGTKVTWMDGSRLVGRNAGRIFSFDFDGSNQQGFVATRPDVPVVFDRDYTVLYSVDGSDSSLGVYASDLRLDGDK